MELSLINRRLSEMKISVPRNDDLLILKKIGYRRKNICYFSLDSAPILFFKQHLANYNIYKSPYFVPSAILSVLNKNKRLLIIQFHDATFVSRKWLLNTKWKVRDCRNNISEIIIKLTCTMRHTYL